MQFAFFILNAIKNSAIDCKIHNKPNTTEYKQCFTFVSPSIDKYVYKPNYKNDENDKSSKINKVEIKWVPEAIKFKGQLYMLKRDDPKNPFGKLYDYDKYKKDETRELVGKLIRDKRANKIAFVKI